MVKVAICDDNRKVMDYYSDILEQSAAENGIDVKVRHY